MLSDFKIEGRQNVYAFHSFAGHRSEILNVTSQLSLNSTQMDVYSVKSNSQIEDRKENQHRTDGTTYASSHLVEHLISTIRPAAMTT